MILDEILLFSISKPYESISWNGNGEVLCNGMLTTDVLISPSHTEKTINVRLEINDIVVNMPKTLDLDDPITLRGFQKEAMKHFPKEDIKFIHKNFVDNLMDLESYLNQVLAEEKELPKTYQACIRRYNLLMNKIILTYEDLGLLPLSVWIRDHCQIRYLFTSVKNPKDDVFVIKGYVNHTRIKIQKHIKSYNEEYKELKEEVEVLRGENERLKKEIELFKFKYERKGRPKILAEKIYEEFLGDKGYKKDRQKNIISVLTCLINEARFIDINKIKDSTDIRSPQTIREICKLLENEEIIESEERGRKTLYRYILKKSI